MTFVKSRGRTMALLMMAVGVVLGVSGGAWAAGEFVEVGGALPDSVVWMNSTTKQKTLWKIKFPDKAFKDINVKRTASDLTAVPTSGGMFTFNVWDSTNIGDYKWYDQNNNDITSSFPAVGGTYPPGKEIWGKFSFKTAKYDSLGIPFGAWTTGDKGLHVSGSLRDSTLHTLGVADSVNSVEFRFLLGKTPKKIELDESKRIRFAFRPQVGDSIAMFDSVEYSQIARTNSSKHAVWAKFGGTNGVIGEDSLGLTGFTSDGLVEWFKIGGNLGNSLVTPAVKVKEGYIEPGFDYYAKIGLENYDDDLDEIYSWDTIGLRDAVKANVAGLPAGQYKPYLKPWGADSIRVDSIKAVGSEGKIRVTLLARFGKAVRPTVINGLFLADSVELGKSMVEEKAFWVDSVGAGYNSFAEKVDERSNGIKTSQREAFGVSNPTVKVKSIEWFRWKPNSTNTDFEYDGSAANTVKRFKAGVKYASKITLEGINGHTFKTYPEFGKDSLTVQELAKGFIGNLIDTANAHGYQVDLFFKDGGILANRTQLVFGLAYPEIEYPLVKVGNDVLDKNSTGWASLSYGSGEFDLRIESPELANEHLTLDSKSGNTQLFTTPWNFAVLDTLDCESTLWSSTDGCTNKTRGKGVGIATAHGASGLAEGTYTLEVTIKTALFDKDQTYKYKLYVNKGEVVPGLITGLSEPVVGDTIKNPVLTGVNIVGLQSASVLGWAKGSDVANGKLLPANTVFQMDSTYVAKIKLDAKAGYAFGRKTDANKIFGKGATDGVGGDSVYAGAFFGFANLTNGDYGKQTGAVGDSIAFNGKYGTNGDLDSVNNGIPSLVLGVHFTVKQPVITADSIVLGYGTRDTVTIKIRGVPRYSRNLKVKLDAAQYFNAATAGDSIRIVPGRDSLKTVGAEREFLVYGLRKALVNRDWGAQNAAFVKDSVIKVKAIDNVLGIGEGVGISGGVVIKTNKGRIDGASLTVTPRNISTVSPAVDSTYVYDNTDKTTLRFKFTNVRAESGNDSTYWTYLTAGQTNNPTPFHNRETPFSFVYADSTRANVRDAGRSTVWVLGGKNYSDTITTTYAIEPFDITIKTATGATADSVGELGRVDAVTGTIGSTYYTGEKRNLTVKSLGAVGGDVKDSVRLVLRTGGEFGGTQETLDPRGEKDFAVTYANNLNAGTKAEIVVTGKGNYKGTRRIPFTILRAPRPTVVAVTDTVVLPWAERIDLEGTNALRELFVVTHASTPTSEGALVPITSTPISSFVGLIGRNRTYSILSGAGRISGKGILDQIPDAGETYGIDVKTDSTHGDNYNNIEPVYTTAPGAAIVVLGKNAPALTVTPNTPSTLSVVAGNANQNLNAVVNYTGPDSTVVIVQWFKQVSGGAWTKVGNPDSIAGGTGTKTSTLALHDQSDLVANATVRFKAKVEARNIVSGTYAAPTGESAVWTVNAIDNDLVALNFGRLNIPATTVTYTKDGEFKLSALPSVTISGGREAVAGSPADFKVIRLDYIGTGGGVADSVVLNTFAAGAPDLASTQGVKNSGRYDVIVTLKNLNPQSAGYGMEAKNTLDGKVGIGALEVKTRSLSASGIATTLTLNKANEVYDGTDKFLTGSVTYNVTDGGSWLTEGDDYSVAIPELVNAGTHSITFSGIGNYGGTVTKTVTVAKAALAIDASETQTFTKVYDGTKDVDTTALALAVAFKSGDNSVTGMTLGSDYKIAGLTYDKADAGTGRTVTGTITLTDTGSVSRNYKLASGAYKATGVITKAVPAAAYMKTTPAISADEPYRSLYDAKAKTVAVSWKSQYSNAEVKNVGTGKISAAKYSTEDGKAPVEIGTYDVTVDVEEGANFVSATGVSLGSIVIDDGLPPVITQHPVADTSYYAGGSVTLKVVAANPKDGKTSGLKYQWYESKDGAEAALMKGKTAATLAVNTKVTGTYTYYVEVTYSGSEQTAKSVNSNSSRVTVYPEPVSLADAIVTVNQTYDYTGKAIIPAETDLSVTLGQAGLILGQDYEFSGASNNVEAGVNVGKVKIKGINAYKGEASGSFTINRIGVTLEHLSVTYNVDYNGKEQPVSVSPRTGFKGLGEVTASYEPDTLERKGAGSWQVVLHISDGPNFLGIENLPLSVPYTIRTATWSTDLFVVTGLNADNVKNVKWNGQDQGIPKPTLTGLGEFYTGEYKVVYELNGIDYAAAIDSNSAPYIAKIVIDGDANFPRAELVVGEIYIHDETWVSVAEAAREIPNKVTVEEAAVAPVVITAGGVSVGPNPVSEGGEVAIFWDGSKAVSGTLAVYTSTGKKIAVVDVSGTKKIGTWNTAGAPEGAYLLRGALTTSGGEKIKVSVVIGVAK